MRKIYISIDKNNRVLEWSSTFSNGYTEVEIEEGHELLLNPFIFKYVDGVFIKDTAYQDKLIENKKNEQEKKDPLEFIFEQNSYLTIELANTQTELEKATAMNGVLAQQQAQILLLFAKTPNPPQPDTPIEEDTSNPPEETPVPEEPEPTKEGEV